MNILPEDYVVEKFCQYSGYPKQNKRSKSWAAGCPICREGSSWGKKRRLYYKLDKNYIFCFNCGWKGSTLKFIQHITGMNSSEVFAEAEKYDSTNVVRVLEDNNTGYIAKESPPLPNDSINLFDESQLQYWSTNGDLSNRKVIDDAIRLVNSRKLNRAINKPKTLWLSLTDFTHKNRITIPFYSKDGKIIFYQSRSIYKNNKQPKYLSKANSEKSVFNINQVDPTIDSVFLFEGPLDSCFVKNGLGVAGVTTGIHQDLNHLQQSQMEDLRLFKKIWVLDSQWVDQTSKIKTGQLIDQGCNVFIWPEGIGKQYKDLNELCVGVNNPGIGHKFIEKNTYSGMKAKLILNSISNR